jgi:carbon monoxide dehydrogenase subunit G
MMKLKGAVTVNASQEEVWRIFMDPTQLCRVIPGCERAKQLDATHYEAIFSVKVQFMTIRSKALGTLLEAKAPRHMVGELVGEPVAMAGAFRSKVTIDLEPVNGGTNVRYAMDLTMLGRLASMGDAIVRSTSQRLSKEFADNVSKLFNNPGRL